MLELIFFFFNISRITRNDRKFVKLSYIESWYLEKNCGVIIVIRFNIVL